MGSPVERERRQMIGAVYQDIEAVKSMNEQEFIDSEVKKARQAAEPFCQMMDALIEGVFNQQGSSKNDRDNVLPFRVPAERGF
jgi:hypothetical protein